MASAEEIRDIRIAKIALLEQAGKAPYPATSAKTHTIHALITDVETIESAQTSVGIAGRILSLRPQGALIFGTVFDGTGTFQFLLKKNEPTSEALFTLFGDAVDIGDFIEVLGTVFTTKRGEKTVLVQTWNMLSKSLLPLPDKWHGLQDHDERLRKRYLDILFNPDIQEMIRLKAHFWHEIRSFLRSSQFVEVETPTLEVTTGGAEANPFKTHHADFDMDVYLRISVGELWQKRLLGAGIPRVYEIGRAYRNEGTSPEHAQEFTNMEFYASYMNYEEGMKLTEALIQTVIERVFKKDTFSIRGHEHISFKGEWKRISYVETVQSYTGINVLSASEEDMEQALTKLGVRYEGNNKERLIDTLWKYCRKQIAGPVWLIDHPKIVSPLAKAKKDNPDLTERCQLILGGAEVCNGFSELNDPIDQRARFTLQQHLIERGDTEAMMPDWEFVEMLEHGMPPAFGMGFGDRLFAFLVDKPLREVQLFRLYVQSNIIPKS